jgi:hypothetical protein
MIAGIEIAVILHANVFCAARRCSNLHYAGVLREGLQFPYEEHSFF